MYKILKNNIFVLLLFFTFNSISAQNEELAVDKAMEVLDTFMAEFNARDMNSWSETLNYPHVRFSSGKVMVWDTKEEYASVNIFDRLASTGWHYSAWVSRDPILVSKNKVHISTVFQRYDKYNQPIGQYQSLYIVTKEEGRWGVKARSSLAP
tara:strand:+ start:2122 stop:2577 length:456 start_codon:yes stop_codon:yes gene_type:complete